MSKQGRESLSGLTVDSIKENSLMGNRKAKGF